MSFKDEQGMIAMGVAMMLIVVLGLFGGVLWQYSMAEMQRVERTEKDLQALFLARAGAEVVMAAWLDEAHNSKPEGAMDRLYYNSVTESFQSLEPADYLGYVDVVVTKIEDSTSERDQLTEIVATAVVGGVRREVKLTSYPHLFGHDDSLKWYYEETGIIRSYDEPAQELAVIRSKNPIHFVKEQSPPLATGFTAPILLFERPLDLSYDQETSYRIFPEVVNSSLKELEISAETIFFDDVILLYLPATNGKFSMNFNVVLKLPPGMAGTPGSQIPGGDPESNYGKVYFDGNIVGLQEFKWEKTWLIWYRFVKKPNGLTNLRTPQGVNLAGNAFYFRNNTNLRNIKNQDLIYLKDDGHRRNELRTIKPFVWE